MTSADARMLRRVAAECDEGVRLDRFLAQSIATLSRVRLQGLIRSGHVAASGEPILDPGRKVRTGEAYDVEIPEPSASHMEGEAIPLTILYEDDSIIVIDKPAGLVVHPGAGNPKGTLVNALIAHCGRSLSGVGGVARPGIVHRLDKDTSGLLVAAKTDEAHGALAAQFADHGRRGGLVREYLALVWGEPQPRSGVIETRIGRHPASRVKMAVVASGGRLAVTRYLVEASYAGGSGVRGAVASLVRCRLETGRTHQVRVHMAHIATPIVADSLYGAGFRTKRAVLPEQVGGTLALLNRQALHAAVLQFRHPRSGRLLAFESPLPGEIAKLCAEIERSMGKVAKI